MCYCAASDCHSSTLTWDRNTIVKNFGTLKEKIGTEKDTWILASLSVQLQIIYSGLRESLVNPGNEDSAFYEGPPGVHTVFHIIQEMMSRKICVPQINFSSAQNKKKLMKF